MFTEKHFASSFTLTPLSYASKINFRASLCSISRTFFAFIISLFLKSESFCCIIENCYSEKTGFHTQYITVLVSRYKANGLASITESHYHGNHRNLSYAEEEALLEPFRQASNAGKTVSVHDIETAYREAVGHSIGTSQIYYVLHRHGWRKVMPRSKHPKKASDEVIETSKKLTSESAN